MKRFAILLSPNGYEMSTSLPDGQVEIINDDRAKKHVELIWTFTNPNTKLDEYGLRDKVKSYKTKFISQQSKNNGEFNTGSILAYYMRKTHAQVPGQKEYIFALNQEDMDWIYKRNPIDTGLILCKLFMNTKTNEWVDEEIEGRRIIGINKCEEEYWDNIKYDLEDFYDIYTAKKKAIDRRAAR